MTFSETLSRLIDRHLDGLAYVADYDRPQRRVLGVNLRIVHRPESMEEQRVLVPYLAEINPELVSNRSNRGISKF